MRFSEKSLTKRLFFIQPHLPAPQAVDREIEAPPSNNLGSRGTLYKIIPGSWEDPCTAAL